VNRSPKRRSRSNNLPFVVMAIVVIVLMIGGGAAGIVIGTGSSSDDDSGNIDGEQPSVRVTPGEEVARLETVVAKNPNDVDSIRVLAEVLANSGRITDSVPWFENAIALRPDDADLRLAFGRALQRSGSWYDAELQLKRAAELDPTSANAAFYLGQLYENMPEPRVNDARTWYQRAVDLEPDSVVAQQARDRLTAIGDATPVASPHS
jgi:cytochrome c-type biogenesis protein CcmH/NrfG